MGMPWRIRVGNASRCTWHRIYRLAHNDARQNYAKIDTPHQANQSLRRRMYPKTTAAVITHDALCHAY
jgi:hypothetical protein